MKLATSDIYIPLLGSKEPGATKRSALVNGQLDKFLDSKKVLLFLGDAGSDKSVTSKGSVAKTGFGEKIKKVNVGNSKYLTFY